MVPNPLRSVASCVMDGSSLVPFFSAPFSLSELTVSVGMAVIYALLRVRLNNVQNVFVHQKINHRRNRHYFSANGPFLLLPLALKWGLAAFLAMCLLPCLGGQSVEAAEFDGKLTITIPDTALTTTVKAGDPATAGNATSIGVSSTARWGYSVPLLLLLLLIVFAGHCAFPHTKVTLQLNYSTLFCLCGFCDCLCFPQGVVFISSLIFDAVLLF